MAWTVYFQAKGVMGNKCVFSMGGEHVKLQQRESFHGALDTITHVHTHSRHCDVNANWVKQLSDSQSVARLQPLAV